MDDTYILNKSVKKVLPIEIKHSETPRLVGKNAVIAYTSILGDNKHTFCMLMHSMANSDNISSLVVRIFL